MGSILFTDADGAWKLHNGKPFPASRYAGWTPDSQPVGESAARLSDGALSMFRTRSDYGVMFELPMIPSRRSSNLVLHPENFSGAAWVATGSPVLTPADDTLSGITLDRIYDDSALALEGYSQNVGFTGDGAKALSVHVKQGTAAASFFGLLDTTAGVRRQFGLISWNGGIPSVDTAGIGSFLGYVYVGNGVFRLLFTTAAVTAANTNVIEVYAATDAAISVVPPGTLYVGGVQAENATVPTPYLYNTTAARSGVSMVEIALRLRYHLLNGGTCSVHTNDIAGSAYTTCGLKPDTAPQISLSDRRALEFTLSLQLINLAGSPTHMLAHYVEQ